MSYGTKYREILNSQFSILNSKRKSAVIPVSAKPPATGCNGQAYRTAYIQKATARMTIPTTINAVVSG